MWIAVKIVFILLFPLLWVSAHENSLKEFDFPPRTEITEVLRLIDEASSKLNPQKCDRIVFQDYNFLVAPHKIPATNAYCTQLPSAALFCNYTKKIFTPIQNKNKNELKTNATVVTSPPSKANHLASIKWRKKVFQKSSRLFKEILNDNSILNTCCGTDTVCKKRFQSIELIILKSKDPKDRTAYYWEDNASPQIRISENRLLNATHEEDIHRLLLHELGHGCQYSRNPPITPLIINDFCFSTKTTDNDLKQILTADRYNCVQSVIKNNPNTCPGAQAIEAFANLVFVDFWENPSYFKLPCENIEDFSHMQGMKYLKCVVEDPEFQKKMCETQKQSTQ